MPQQKLDLVQFATREMTQSGACPPQVVRRQLVDAGVGRRRADDIPQHLGRHAISPHPPGLVDGTEDWAMGNPSRGRPRVDSRLHPGWDRDGSHVSALADQIGDHPVVLAPLDRVEAEGQQLAAAQSAANQHRDHRVVA